MPILAFLAYVYVVEAERRNWDIFLAGIAFFGFELAWEMLKALILHWTGTSALWTAPGGTAYLVFAGLTIEIAMNYSWWRWPNVWLIVVAYFAGFYGISLFYDLRSRGVKVAITAGAYAMDLVLVIVFVWALKWI